jgi:hypothetical protein
MVALAVRLGIGMNPSTGTTAIMMVIPTSTPAATMRSVVSTQVPGAAGLFVNLLMILLKGLIEELIFSQVYPFGLASVKKGSERSSP